MTLYAQGRVVVARSSESEAAESSSPLHSSTPGTSHTKNQPIVILTFLNAFKSFLGSYSAPESAHRSYRTMGRLTPRQSLESSQSLPSIPLLDTNVDVFVGPNVGGGLVERVPFVCKGICGPIVVSAYSLHGTRTLDLWDWVGLGGKHLAISVLIAPAASPQPRTPDPQ